MDEVDDRAERQQPRLRSRGEHRALEQLAGAEHPREDERRMVLALAEDRPGAREQDAAVDGARES